MQRCWTSSRVLDPGRDRAHRMGAGIGHRVVEPGEQRQPLEVAARREDHRRLAAHPPSSSTALARWPRTRGHSRCRRPPARHSRARGRDRSACRRSGASCPSAASARTAPAHRAIQRAPASSSSSPIAPRRRARSRIGHRRRSALSPTATPASSSVSRIAAMRWAFSSASPPCSSASAMVAGIDAAAGKHQRPAGECHRRGALDHQQFGQPPALAHHDHGRGGNRFSGSDMCPV
jgi:hypothetical protein